MIENDVYFLIVVIDLQNLYYFHVKSIREGILSKCAQLEASDRNLKKKFYFKALVPQDFEGLKIILMVKAQLV